MRRAALLLTLVCAACTRTVYVPTETVRRVTQVVRDTAIAVPVDPERAQSTTRDTCSHLETSLAVSDASVSGGVLHHTLEQLGEVPARIRYIETLRVDSVPVPYPVYVDRPVPQPVPWWQRALMWAGGAAIGAAALRLWRKK